MASTVNRANINSSYEAFNFDEWVLKILSPAPDMSVLDIGFGGGKQIKLIMDKVLPAGKLCGIDLSAECVSNIIKFLNQYDDSHVNIIQGSMDDAPSLFAREKFDLIFSVYAFYYSSDMVKLLLRLSEMLVSGGRICIFGYGHKSNEQIIKIINTTGRDNLPAYKDFISEEHIQKASKLFSSVKTERLNNIIRIPSKDKVQSWLRSSGLYYDGLFKAIDAAIDSCIRSKGAFELTKETLCVTFIK
jgi:ubiquinone/menaquinone biosynthesis C-methylase UbiE